MKTPDPELLLSGRSSKTITDLFAIVIKDGDGMEGVVRRDTPIGTQALVTDDAALTGHLMAMARQNGNAGAYVVRFTRQ